jgi:hypothetical protein
MRQIGNRDGSLPFAPCNLRVLSAAPAREAPPGLPPGGGRLTAPQDCGAAHHAWWRKAPMWNGAPSRACPGWTSCAASLAEYRRCDPALGHGSSIGVRGRPRCRAARRPVSVLPPLARRGLQTGVRDPPRRGRTNEEPATRASTNCGVTPPRQRRPDVCRLGLGQHHP